MEYRRYWAPTRVDPQSHDGRGKGLDARPKNPGWSLRMPLPSMRWLEHGWSAGNRQGGAAGFPSGR